jgi:hypothetical protein
MFYSISDAQDRVNSVLLSNGCIFNIIGLRARLGEAEEGLAAATARAETADGRAAESAGLLRDAEANAACLQARLADAEAWLADAMRAKETRAAKEAERAAAAEAEAAHQHAMLRASQDQVSGLSLSPCCQRVLLMCSTGFVFHLPTAVVEL